MKTICLIISYTLFYLTLSCNAQQQQQNKEQKLEVGLPPPSMDGAIWVKGAPVPHFEKGKAYVVDFGFIGCVPCMAGWPKLTKLQDKYKNDVTFIIVMTHAKQINKVKKYLDNNPSIDVSVAYDPVIIDESITKTEHILDQRWLVSNNLAGYPTLIYIDKKGNVAYIGKGKHSVEEKLSFITDTEKLIGKPFVSKDQIRDSLQYNFRKNFNSLDYDQAMNCIDNLIRMYPDELEYKKDRFDLLIKADENQAYTYAREVLNTYPFKEMNNAWDLAKTWISPIRGSYFTGALENPDYDLAIEMCLKTISLETDQQLIALSYAHAGELCFMKGDTSYGEELMLKSIAFATSKEMKERHQKRLRSYKEKF